MKPARRRELARFAHERFRVSERRACGLLLLNRSTHRYRSRKKDPAALRLRLRELAEARRRFGYRRLHVLLQREGWKVNHKLVYRLYTEEGLSVRTKRRTKRASHLRVVRPPAQAPNERWSLDFMADELVGGRRFRILTAVDQFSRLSPLLVADFSLTGAKVVDALERVSLLQDLPEVITVDNGSEFASKAMDAWAYRNGVRLDFIRPGKPVENAYIESFNSRLRDECLNGELFFSIEDARRKLEAWRRDYNRHRPHSSIGNLAPIEFERKSQINRTTEARILKL